MSWLHRLQYTKSLWKGIHGEDVVNTIFDPMCYNFDQLAFAKRKIKNPVWAEIYKNLRKCSLSVVRVYPGEQLTIPVFGELDIRKKFTSVKQEWCKNIQVHQKLNVNGTIKNADRMPEGIKPLEMELNALKNAIEEKLTKLRVRAFGDKPELCIRELRPCIKPI